MCNFFSFCSNGRGRFLFFDVKDIQKIEDKSNKDKYYYDSHASICDYFKVDEDKHNKYEFNPETNKFKIDQINTKDDSKDAKEWVLNFWKNSKLFFVKLHKSNSGNSNSGDSNSGDRNSGDSNSGDRNSGDRNSGDSNSGHWNSGYKNSGDRNSGDWNSGHRNSGDWNSGHWNSGDRNSGDWNSGHRNSGDRNSGDWNSGDWNSGNFNTNKPNIRIFNKETNVKEIKFPQYFYFEFNYWKSLNSMTLKEQNKNKNCKVLGGILIELSYKNAWKKSFENKCTKKQAEMTLQLPNFDFKIFKSITGISKSMLLKKIKTLKRCVVDGI